MHCGTHQLPSVVSRLRCKLCHDSQSELLFRWDRKHSLRKSTDSPEYCRQVKMDSFHPKGRNWELIYFYLTVPHHVTGGVEKGKWKSVEFPTVLDVAFTWFLLTFDCFPDLLWSCCISLQLFIFCLPEQTKACRFLVFHLFLNWLLLSIFHALVFVIDINSREVLVWLIMCLNSHYSGIKGNNGPGSNVPK